MFYINIQETVFKPISYVSLLYYRQLLSTYIKGNKLDVKIRNYSGDFISLDGKFLLSRFDPLYYVTLINAQHTKALTK